VVLGVPQPPMGRRTIQIVAACAAALPPSAAPAARPRPVGSTTALRGAAPREGGPGIFTRGADASSSPGRREGTITTPVPLRTTTGSTSGCCVSPRRSGPPPPGKVVSVGYATGFEGYGKHRPRAGDGPNVVRACMRTSPSMKVPLGGRRWRARANCSASPAAPVYCTGTHLHFEVRRKTGSRVDPRKFLGR